MEAEDSRQHYNLKWNNFKDNLLQIFTEQLDKELLTDVIISCEGKLIKAHRMVLAACSVYFQQLFEVYTVPNPLIILNGVKMEDLKQILTFMYLGEIKVSEDRINTILTLANEFQVKGLSNIVFNNIIEKQKETPKKQESQERQTINSFNNDKQIKDTPPNYHRESNKSKSLLLENRRTTVSPTKTTQSENTKTTKPPIAFMIFQNEWRTKISEKYPNENNKELSVRLSTMWKRLSPQHKAKYYYLAKKAANAITNPPPTKRKKVEHASPQTFTAKQEDNDDDVKSDSSDGLEIVEEETELIDITEEDDKSNLTKNNNLTAEGSLTDNT